MDNPFEFHEEDGIIACVGNNGGTTDEDIRNGFKRTVELLTEYSFREPEWGSG